VNYVDDRLLQLQYLIVRGTSEGILAVRSQVNSHVPLYTRDSVRAALQPDKGDYDPIFAIYLAALLAPPETEPEILAWYQDAMSSRDAEVRRAAYAATTYPAWRAFEQPLKLASERDPDPVARDLASRALSSLTRNIWSKG
jgi:hypothetical protein